MNATLERLQRRLDESPNPIEETEPLRPEDFRFIGQWIQSYCFSDLNGRRIIDALRHAAIGPEARYASQLQDAQVFPKLIEAAALLWPSDRRDGIISAANTIEMHRLHRHNFAHWAVRRLRGENFFLLLSKNAREAGRRDGDPQQSDELKYGIVEIDGLLTELSKLDSNGQYLAVIAADIERHFEEIKRDIERFGEA